jgi:hypothetical protein
MWEFPHQHTLCLLEYLVSFVQMSCTNSLCYKLLQTVLGYREISSHDLPNTENERGTGCNIGVYCNMRNGHEVFHGLGLKSGHSTRSKRVWK